MMRCPNCGKEYHPPKCECGYDLTRDCEAFPTLMPVRRADWEQKGSKERLRQKEKEERERLEQKRLVELLRQKKKEEQDRLMQERQAELLRQVKKERDRLMQERQAEILRQKKKEEQDCLMQERQAELLRQKEKEERERLEREQQQHLEQERQFDLYKQNEKKRKKKKRNFKIISATVVVACIAFVIVLQTVIIPSQKFMGQSARVGDIIVYGTYEQDNNASNGKEDIEWVVLDRKYGKALVISKYALDCKPYNTEWKDITWEDCTLRKWLNSDFLNAAFTAEEQKLIPTVTVSADKNPEYSTNPGNATQDQVFLLSIPEVNKYFSSDAAMICKPTPYAVTNNAYKSDSGSCWWWLRSPGFNPCFAAVVSSISYAWGSGVDDGDLAVRPALWINLES